MIGGTGERKDFLKEGERKGKRNCDGISWSREKMKHKETGTINEYDCNQGTNSEEEEKGQNQFRNMLD